MASSTGAVWERNIWDLSVLTRPATVGRSVRFERGLALGRVDRGRGRPGAGQKPAFVLTVPVLAQGPSNELEDSDRTIVLLKLEDALIILKLIQFSSVYIFTFHFLIIFLS